MYLFSYYSIIHTSCWRSRKIRCSTREYKINCSFAVNRRVGDNWESLLLHTAFRCPVTTDKSLSTKWEEVFHLFAHSFVSHSYSCIYNRMIGSLTSSELFVANTYSLYAPLCRSAIEYMIGLSSSSCSYSSWNLWLYEQSIKKTICFDWISPFPLDSTRDS